jgi:glycosyltransferase involved in cell wall biosynthesis
MGLLGLPFIFGPVGGGERAPMRLRKSSPLKGKIIDGLWDIISVWVKYSPLMRITFSTAEEIYVTSTPTKNLIPRKYQGKVIVQLAIGSDQRASQPIVRSINDGKIVILYVGQMLYLKGLHLGIRAFAKFIENSPRARLTIVGKGTEQKKLVQLAIDLNVEEPIAWVNW